MSKSDPNVSDHSTRVLETEYETQDSLNLLIYWVGSNTSIIHGHGLLRSLDKGLRHTKLVSYMMEISFFILEPNVLITVEIFIGGG